MLIREMVCGPRHTFMRPFLDTWIWIAVTALVVLTTAFVLINSPDRHISIPAPAVAKPQ